MARTAVAPALTVSSSRPTDQANAKSDGANMLSSTFADLVRR